MKQKNKLILKILISVLIFIILSSVIIIITTSKSTYNFNLNNDERNDNKKQDIFELKTVEAKPSQVKANVPIFMYHFILDDYGTNWDFENFVKPSTLEEQIKYIVDNGYETIFAREVNNLQKYNKPVCLTFDDCFVYFYNNAYPLFKKYNVKATIFIITDYIGGENYLTEAQIKEMSDSGLIDVQSHTKNHLDLTSLSNEKLEEQLKASKERLEKITGKQVDTICYPYGRFNNNVISKARELYEIGLAMDGGTLKYNSNTTNILELDRIYATRTMSLNEYKTYLNKSYVDVKW